MGLDEWVEYAALRGAVVIEAVAGLVILLASLRAGWRTVELAWVRHMGARAADRVRLDLGKGLSVALEFLVGADVLRTAVAPSWVELGQLAAIVGIRSALNFALERERKSLEEEIAADAATAAAGGNGGRAGIDAKG